MLGRSHTRTARIALASTLLVAVATSPPVLAQTPAPADISIIAPTITPGAFTEMQKSRSVILLDVRETEEFAVSRIPGATRVSPASTPQALVASLGNRVRGAVVVLYCALGTRSHDVAQAAYHDLIARGAAGVFVLTGGIIEWHNQSRPLVDASGSTRFVHPYKDELKPGMSFPEMARLTPAVRPVRQAAQSDADDGERHHRHRHGHGHRRH